MAEDAGEARAERCPSCQHLGAHGRRTGIMSNQPYAPDSDIWTLRCDACAHSWEFVNYPGAD